MSLLCHNNWDNKFLLYYGLDSNSKLDNYFIYYTYKFENQPPFHELYHP